MTVIKFIDAKNEEKALDYLVGKKITTIKAREGIVYDLEPEYLNNLNELNIKYQEFKDDGLSEILDENGLATLNLLRKSIEEYCAPTGYLGLHIDVDEEHVLDAKRIIDKYKPFKFIARQCTVAKVSDSGTTERNGTAIITTIPKKDLETLINNLANSRIAGYDEDHKIYVSGFNR